MERPITCTRRRPLAVAWLLGLVCNSRRPRWPLNQRRPAHPQRASLQSGRSRHVRLRTAPPARHPRHAVVRSKVTELLLSRPGTTVARAGSVAASRSRKSQPQISAGMRTAQQTTIEEAAVVETPHFICVTCDALARSAWLIFRFALHRQIALPQTPALHVPWLVRVSGRRLFSAALERVKRHGMLLGTLVAAVCGLAACSLTNLPAPPECIADDECGASHNGCSVGACINARCEFAHLAGGELSLIQPSTCWQAVCSGTGDTRTEPQQRGAECGVGLCDGTGNCVDCLDDDDCSAGWLCDRNISQCITPTCSDGEQNGSETDDD